MPGGMVVLVPEKLKMLQGVCLVHNDCESLQQLKDFIGAMLNGRRHGPAGSV